MIVPGVTLLEKRTDETTLLYQGVEIASRDDILALTKLLTMLFTQEADFSPNEAQQSAGLELIINDPRIGQILLLRQGGEIVGMANLLYTVSTALGGKVAILEDMVVHPDHRGTGCGSLLLQGAIEHARMAGCKRITLLTDHDNHAAQRFYRRHGFVDSSMVPLRLALP